MHKIGIINKNEKIEIIIDKVKIICGNGYEKKDMIIKVANNYFNKLNDSDYSKECSFSSKILFDESPLRINDFDYFHLSGQFDLDNDLKLGTKSISLAFVNSLFDNIEYNEDFQMINTLLVSMIDDILMDFNNEYKAIINLELTKKLLIKLMTVEIAYDDSIINNYDLSLKDRILIQLNMLKIIIKKTSKNILIILDVPYVDDDILNIINSLNAFCLVLCSDINSTMDLDYLFVDSDKVIDIANDNQIFDLCNNSNSHLTIKEMKNRLIQNHLKKNIK